MVDIEDDTGIVTVDRHNLVAERVQHRTRAPIAAQPQKISKDGRAEGDWMGRAIGRADNRCGCAIDHGVEEGASSVAVSSSASSASSTAATRARSSGLSGNADAAS